MISSFNLLLTFCILTRLDFRRLPGPVFDPRAHFPEQRLVIERTS